MARSLEDSCAKRLIAHVNCLIQLKLAAPEETAQGAKMQEQCDKLGSSVTGSYNA